jgi:hypothetical protein
MLSSDCQHPSCLIIAQLTSTGTPYPSCGYQRFARCKNISGRES